MKNFLLGVTIGLSLLASGCISPTETVNAPAVQNMTKEVASSVVFSPFIQRYAKHLEAISGETIHPLIQVGHLKNKTKDPSFQMDLIADVFCTELLESGRFEISVAAGSAGRLFPFAESLVNKSLRKNGTLENGSILFWDEPEANINPQYISIIVELLLELQRKGVQIFISTHDYMIASYFEVKKQEEDQIVFHSLYRAEDTDGVQYEKADRFANLKNNAIVAAFKKLLNEIYDLGL